MSVIPSTLNFEKRITYFKPVVGALEQFYSKHSVSAVNAFLGTCIVTIFLMELEDQKRRDDSSASGNNWGAISVLFSGLLSFRG